MINPLRNVHLICALLWSEDAHHQIDASIKTIEGPYMTYKVSPFKTMKLLNLKGWEN